LKSSYRIALFSLILSAFIFSCATVPQMNESPEQIKAKTAKDEIQKDLVDSANWALGRKKLVVQGRTFNMDCSGVLMAVYYRSGIDLQSKISSYSGGGVMRLYKLMDDNNLLYRQPVLAPGDILFWDNTYDKNEDGKWNDEFTHVGMVVKVDKKGNILYIHLNYRTGIVLARMNLNAPDDLNLNSPMRARDAEPGHAPLWLSSHLLRQAAKGYELGRK